MIKGRSKTQGFEAQGRSSTRLLLTGTHNFQEREGQNSHENSQSPEDSVTWVR